MGSQQVEAFVSSKLPFLPEWSDSLQRFPAPGTTGLRGLELDVNDRA